VIDRGFSPGPASRRYRLPGNLVAWSAFDAAAARSRPLFRGFGAAAAA